MAQAHQIFLGGDFRGTVKIFSETASSFCKRHHSKDKYWDWGPVTIWHNIKGVQFFPHKSLQPSAMQWIY